MALPPYTPGDALAYVTEKGWEHKISGDEILLKSCPICGRDGYKFAINNDSGAWLDHHASCSKRGSFMWLRKEMGDLDVRALAPTPIAEQVKPKTKSKVFRLDDLAPFEQNLAADQEAQDYITGRGITMETARAWHLGSKVDSVGKWLLIPYLTSEGICADVKYRGIPDKRFRRMGGGDSILFGEAQLAEGKSHTVRKLYICEAELDAITLWQHGYRPAVSTTTGAGSFNARWFELIKMYNPTEIVICYDSDPAGQDGAAKLLARLDEFKAKSIVLPTKDCNEFFSARHTTEEFDALLADAQEPEIESVLSLGAVFDRLETLLFLNGDAFDGVPTQFNELDPLLGGGYGRGMVTLVSGISGAGKTSFVLQELFWLAQTHQTPTYLLCLEMPVEMMLRKLINHRFGNDINKISLQHVQQYRPSVEHVGLYLGQRLEKPNVDALENAIRQAVRRYGVQVMAFDNINFFVRPSGGGHNQAEQESAVSKRLKDLAIELNIAMLVISQPKKFDSNEKNMTSDDVRGSVALIQDADNVILLSRRRRFIDAQQQAGDRGGSFHSAALFRVDKARYSPGGEALLWFAGERSTYRSLTPDELAEVYQAGAQSPTNEARDAHRATKRRT